jgi:hypothetical protein
VQAGR